MADSTLRRYIWLVNTILQAGPLTFREISERWDASSLNSGGSVLSKRTFHNHRSAILTELGVDIQCMSMRENSRYYIANREETETNDILSWLKDSVATESLLLENQAIADRIVLEPIPGGREWLPIICKALRENRRIVFRYTSFFAPAPKNYDRLMDPLCLKLFKRRWYMLAQSPEDKSRRIFALDRITALRLNETVFDYPRDFSAKDYFSEFYGIYTEAYSRPTRIVLKCFREFPKYMASLPLHHSQQMIEQGADYTVFEYFLAPTFDFIQEILSHGNDIEVIAPQWLRDAILTKAKTVVELYQ